MWPIQLLKLKMSSSKDDLFEKLFLIEPLQAHLDVNREGTSGAIYTPPIPSMSLITQPETHETTHSLVVQPQVHLEKQIEGDQNLGISKAMPNADKEDTPLLEESSFQSSHSDLPEVSFHSIQSDSSIIREIEKL